MREPATRSEEWGWRSPQSPRCASLLREFNLRDQGPVACSPLSIWRQCLMTGLSRDDAQRSVQDHDPGECETQRPSATAATERDFQGRCREDLGHRSRRFSQISESRRGASQPLNLCRSAKSVCKSLDCPRRRGLLIICATRQTSGEESYCEAELQL